MLINATGLMQHSGAPRTISDEEFTSRLNNILFDKKAYRKEKRQKQRAKLRQKERVAGLVCVI